MRRLIVLVTVMCIVGGAGPAAELAMANEHSAYATEQSLPLSSSVTQASCMTLPQLNELRLAAARQALTEPDPVASYRVALDDASAVAATQPYACIAGLRTAILADDLGMKLVKLDYEGPLNPDPVDTSWNLDMSVDLSQVGIDANGNLLYNGAIVVGVGSGLASAILELINRGQKSAAIDLVAKALNVAAATAAAVVAAISLGCCGGGAGGGGGGGGGGQSTNSSDRER